MARLAFVVGSNGPSGALQPLKYAKRDVERIAAALRAPRCGFKVTVASNTSDPFLLRQELFKFAQAAQEDDVIVVYFSGHGIIHSGGLVLLLDNSSVQEILTSAFPSADFLTAIGASKSRNKLLILDCCNAGAVARAYGLKGAGTPVEELGIKAENHMILMASGHLESARELDQFEAGFLTKSICDGLTTRFREADHDQDGALSLQDMRKWLERSAVQHNRAYPDQQVPIPQQFGRSKGELFLTVPRSWRPHYLDWPDGSVMVVLPKVSSSGRALCIGKTPVTNRQYKTFVAETEAREPRSGRSFRPWRDPRFKADDQPIVCVSYYDAVEYCRWVDSKRSSEKGQGATKLPSPQLWDLAAFASEWFSSNPEIWQAEPRWPRAKTKAPFAAKAGTPTNARGIFPMLGNIWEWCLVEWGEYTWDKVPGNLEAWKYPGEIRGGSFLEEMEAISDVKLEFDQFPGGINSRDRDMGFRIASEIPLSNLPDDIRESLPNVVPSKKTKKLPVPKKWRAKKKK